VGGRVLTLRLLVWSDAQRMVSRPMGPILALNALVDDATELDVLMMIEGLTNPLAREAAGALASVPPERRYLGANAGLVMTPFVLPSVSRFSGGAYGMLYAGATIETALRESGHYQGRRLFAMAAPAGTTVPMFSFGLCIDSVVVDIRKAVDTDVEAAIYDADSYSASQPFGAAMRDDGHNGLHYDSVRHTDGECVGLFWPDGVQHATAGPEWRYYFDGARISEYAQVASA
jgi:hypothetical protein